MITITLIPHGVAVLIDGSPVYTGPDAALAGALRRALMGVA